MVGELGGRNESEEAAREEEFHFSTQAVVLAPCQNTCPVQLQCFGYLSLIGQGKFEEAYKLIRQRLPFPRILGRICDSPCEPECLRTSMDETVAIREVKRFVGDWAFDNGIKYTARVRPRRKEKVAIVGAGPAGLSAAHDLAREGFQVTVFDELPVAGGMLAVGVPAHRLPREVLESEIENLTELGVEIRLNCRVRNVGRLLQDGYDAVFIAVGTHRGVSLPVPGADSSGMFTGAAFLRAVLLGECPEVGRIVLVVGGGDVAFDCARTAVRLGCKVHVFSRRSRREVAEGEQVKAAEEEGVMIHPSRAITKILHENGRVTGVESREAGRIDLDDGTSARVDTLPGSGQILTVDAVIMAAGQGTDLEGLAEDIDLAITEQGVIRVDPRTLATSIGGIFAGGDAATACGSVIQAIADGQRAALSITSYLNGEKPSANSRREDDELIPFSTEPVSDDQLNEYRPQVKGSLIPLESRLSTFAEVTRVYSSEQAIAEAARCLRCDLRRPQEAVHAHVVTLHNREMEYDRIRTNFIPSSQKTLRRNLLHGLGAHKVINLKRKADVVYSVSCGVFGMLSEVVASMKVMDHLGLEYTYLPEERCCGLTELEAGCGTAEDFKRTQAAVQEFAEWNLARAKEAGAKILPYFCQWCYYIAKKCLPEEQEVRLVYFLDILVDHVDELRQLKPSLPATRVGYFEGCHIRNLSYAPGININWKSYRQLVELIEGVEVVELPNWKCCVVYYNDIVQEAIDKGLECIVTPCAACWTWLTRRRRGLSIEMTQSLLARALGDKLL